MLKKIEEHKYEELRDYINFILQSFILKENDNHTIEVLKEIEERVKNYDNNFIIL